jgi:hypothetical protein
MRSSNIKILLTLIATSFVFSSQGQFGIALKNSSIKCKAFKDISSEEKYKIETAYNEGFNDTTYKMNVEPLINLYKQNQSTLSNIGQLYLIDKIIDTYIMDIIIDDSCIYNLNQTVFGQLNLGFETFTKIELEVHSIRLAMAQRGFEVLNYYFNTAINLADEETKNYFRKKRLNYIAHTPLLDELYEKNFLKDFQDGESWKLNNLSETIQNGIDKDINMSAFKQAKEDYAATNFNPKTDYVGLNLGFSSFYSRDLSLGGEVSADWVQFANPFKFYDSFSSDFALRFSILGAGYHQNITTKDNDFSFYALRLTNTIFFNVAQFGVKWGPSFPSDKAYWYMRPEFGFSYAIFSFTYGYNFMFDESVRDLTDRSVINFKISYPLIRLSR